MSARDGAAPAMDGTTSEGSVVGDASVAHDTGLLPIDSGMPDAKPLVMYACNGSPVSSCSQCSGKTLGCVYCDKGGGAGLTGLCLPQNELCFNSPPSNTRVCPCAFPNASACPLANQACRDYDPNYCTTCGDPNSNGSPCKQGGTCDRESATCN